MNRITTKGRIGFALLFALAVLGRPATAADAIEYNRDIRPILAENCFACHGADSAARKADLRLDQRDAAIKAEAIVPGNVESGELLERIAATDRDEIMPPPKTKKTLSAHQKDLLKRWIAAGAEYQPHWSLIAPVRPPVPAVKAEAWVKNPIDRFVLAQLEARNLQPAPEADRRTLARRLSLDLTGLPPDPEEVDSFVNDTAPDAYERYVDKLMGKHAWGEHRGRYWLDAARYADTHGIHFDNFREMWTYREWVINAFNRNLPFDQFTIKQLAGDLLPNRTLDDQVASGFNRCNITSNEGGLIPEEYLVLYTRDRTETTSQVFMGLTTGCRVCHDHKFDPISQKEFYELAAFFNNTTQAAMDGNISNTPPIVFVPQATDRARWEGIDGALAEARGQIEERKKSARAEFDKWALAATPEELAKVVPADGLTLHAPFDEGKGNTINLVVDGKPRPVDLSGDTAWKPGHAGAQALHVKNGTMLEVAEAGDFEGDRGFSYGAWVKLPPNANGSIIARMDDQHDFRGWDIWMEGNKVATHIINKWPADALKVVTNEPLKPGEWNHIFITYDGSRQPVGIKIYVNGKAQAVTAQANTLTGSIKTTVPFKLAQRQSTSRINDLTIQDLRIYGRALSAEDVEKLKSGARIGAIASKPVDQRTEAEKTELYDWWLASTDAEYQKRTSTLKGLEQEKAAIQSRGTIAHVMQEKPETAMAFILFRGDYDKRRDQVKPHTPAALPPMPDDLPKDRLGLAQWLLRPEHPLTARVTVNRFWQELFGTGLVRTAGDFGVSGELPSHPELLDWLAVEFRESGWDIKAFYKLLVTSATYRQQALTTPEKLEKDPSNRFLSRGPRFRMDAEMVRDYALAASGLLRTKLGGPSVKPYQPEGVWEAVAMIGSNTRDYKRDTGDDLYRRSLYTFWKRAAPPASMDIFNAPSREVCTVRRERTDTPLQALVTLNDPQFVEAARHLAELTLKTGGPTPENRLDLMARRLLARSLRPEETQVVQASLNELVGFYQSHPDDAKALIAVGESKADPAVDPSALAAWTMLANEMLNLDEVLNK